MTRTICHKYIYKMFLVYVCVVFCTVSSESPTGSSGDSDNGSSSEDIKRNTRSALNETVTKPGTCTCTHACTCIYILHTFARFKVYECVAWHFHLEVCRLVPQKVVVDFLSLTHSLTHTHTHDTLHLRNGSGPALLQS